MPIEFHSTSSELRVSQSFVSPTVYLDHWAIRLFSDDLTLQNRLVNTLRDKGGTLLISNISLGEFAGPTDPQHARAAEEFIERLLPNIYLTDFAFDKILERERLETNNKNRFWPSADLDQLKLLAERSLLLSELSSSPNRRITMDGFINMSYQNRNAMIEVTKEVVQQIIAGIKNARSDPSYLFKAKTVKPDCSRPRMLIIHGELMREYYVDLAKPIRENDIVDMLHAAMPLNCCDYVLLDGPWTEQVEKMRRRINKFDSSMQIAKCFSQRNQGVQNFLNDIEDFDQHNIINPAIKY